MNALPILPLKKKPCLITATIADLLQYRKCLQASSDSAALDVELLLCHCLHKDRSYLKAWPEADVPKPTVDRFLSLLQRRFLGEPIAYLTGSKAFWSLNLHVSPAVLIPRPETELLVEKTLQCITQATQVRVLDLGTGSGAIALALAAEQPQWSIEGCDNQAHAILLASSNQQRLGINNVQFYQSNWFSSVPSKPFDIIVSNPPYINPNDPCLQEGDVRFEPLSALIAGQRGMAAIETIIKQSSSYLKQHGWLLLEHAYDQGSQVRHLLTNHGFTQIKTCKDLAGLDRVSLGRLHYE